MTEAIYTKRSERIKAFFTKAGQVKDGLSHIIDNWRPVLNGEIFMTDRELSERLRVTRRTLHDYRDKGIVPYYSLGGKYLYSERDISKLLRVNYIPSGRL